MTASGLVPNHLILATDLSARCDRARDRAVMLVRRWNGRLTAVHALDVLHVPNDQPSRPTLEGALARAERLLRADFADVKDIAVDFRVGRSRPGDLVLEIATTKDCGLVVTGIAGNEPLGQSLLGSTVTAIIRHAAVPVLVVKKRPTGPYRRVVMASDLSEASRPALELALALFKEEEIILFHAFDMPFGTWVSDPEEYRETCRREAVEKGRAFLAENDKNRNLSIQIVVVDGDPAPRLADYVAENQVDLIVAGKHGRSGIMQALLGSVVSAILDEAPCDILIVPDEGRVA